MGYDSHAFARASERDSIIRPVLRYSMRSRTLVLAVVLVCLYILTNRYGNLHFSTLSDIQASQYAQEEELLPPEALEYPPEVQASQYAQQEELLPLESLEHPPDLEPSNLLSASNSFDETIPESGSVATIGKITMLYGEANPIYERALQSHIAHGDKHNYPVFILREKLLGRLWSKPAYIMSVILDELKKPAAERLKWLFWFDADTFLLNPKIPLDMFLPPSPEFDHIHFLCGNDHHGLNDGGFFMRVNTWTLHLMAAAISLQTFHPEIDLKYSEQSAIEYLVKNETVYMAHAAMVPQRWYNAFMGARTWNGILRKHKPQKENSVKEGDLLVHFAGGGETKRLRMTRFMDAYEQDSTRWRLEPEDTGYENELAAFWRQWAEVHWQETQHASIEEGVSVQDTDTNEREITEEADNALAEEDVQHSDEEADMPLGEELDQSTAERLDQASKDEYEQTATDRIDQASKDELEEPAADRIDGTADEELNRPWRRTTESQD